jgi:hypothetical protein
VLAAHVRKRAAELRRWPSGRQVMTEFRVGRPKAAAALAALRNAGFDPESTMSPPEIGAPTESPGDVDDAAPEQLATAPTPTTRPARRWGAWPLLLIALGAFVSIWGGWVGLGELTGFGPIALLPGIADHVVINSAITLPIGVEAYAAFALRIWLAPNDGLSETAHQFARWSAIASLVLGAAGQIAYHLMIAVGVTAAPWPITAFVSCLPVAVLGCAAALTHLIHRSHPRV